MNLTRPFSAQPIRRRGFLLGAVAVAGSGALGCQGEARPAPAKWPVLPPEPPPPALVPPPAIADALPVPEPPPEPQEPVFEPWLDLPPRSPTAETGSAFLERTEGLGRGAMDDATVEAILSGNVPPTLRRLVPLAVERDGIAMTLYVACDYLAIGSDEDFVRMPMTCAAAQRIADACSAGLPTARIVDEIYRQAPAKIHPSWIDGGPTYGTLRDWRQHNDKLEERRLKAGHPLGTLIAGHKKDIVVAQKMVDRPERVLIYGWHKREGEVVQPLSDAHFIRYADYSHGVRLIHQRVEIEGAVMTYRDALRDPDLGWTLCDDGPLTVTEYERELPPSP